jgi:flagellar M-ring protein FliF
MSISEVKFARVHLTLKKSGLYQSAEEQAKASVIIRLKPNAELNGKQVQGIQQLVASAVEGMTLEHVVVLDEEGRALSAGDGVAAMPERMQLASHIEVELQQKAAELLQHSFGRQGAQVSVRVLMNFDRIKSVREQPIVSSANPAILREKQLSSNTGGVEDAEGRRSQTTREVDYVVGKERSEVEHAVGSIERISVGVVLPIAQPESVMQEMQHLLEAALGLNAKRGDQLVIAYMPLNLVGNDFADKATAPAVVDPIMPLPESPQDTRWLVGLGILAMILLLSLLIIWRRTKRDSSVQVSSVAPMSPAEREQFLVDLQHWLQEGR